MVRAKLRETRSPEETNWDFAIEVWACAWTIEKVHKTSSKLKLHFYFINLYVTLTWSKITLEEICRRSFKYSLILEYDLSKVPFMLNFRNEIKKKKKNAFHTFILIRKPKESPRRGIEPRSPA